jgi:hypothetical protein
MMVFRGQRTARRGKAMVPQRIYFMGNRIQKLAMFQRVNEADEI